MKLQHRGRGGPDDPMGRQAAEHYAAEHYADGRPLPGVEFEELIGSPAAPRPRAPRWTTAVLAVGAAAATMGLGGHLLVGPESGRNADGIAAASRAAGSRAVLASAAPERSQALPSEGARLPLGFAVTEAAPVGPAGNDRLIVLGFVTRQEPVSVRLLDPDGSIAADVVVESRSVDLGQPSGGALWAFEAVLEVPPAARFGGPEGRALEVWWTSDPGVTAVCSVPLAGPGAHPGAPLPLLPLELYAPCR
jgi:hypothetical protein